MNQTLNDVRGWRWLVVVLGTALIGIGAGSLFGLIRLWLGV
jgi:hypothetical protein